MAWLFQLITAWVLHLFYISAVGGLISWNAGYYDVFYGPNRRQVEDYMAYKIDAFLTALFEFDIVEWWKNR